MALEWEEALRLKAGQQGSATGLMIRGGTLADHQSEFVGDVLVQAGKITAIGPSLNCPERACVEVDARNLYVLPGGIDVHTHFNIDVGLARSCDDFYTGTRAAACGGTTSIVDHMGFGPQGCDLFHQLNVYQQAAKESAVIDYGFHGVIQHIDDRILEQMQAMVEEEGVSSFKLYLTYGYKLDDQSVFKALKRLKQVGALTAVHPENDAVLNLKREELVAAGNIGARFHGAARPLECEAEAISRMINLAKMADDAPLYLVHVSNGLGLDYARLARANKQSVWVETCTQYLVLDESCYQREDAENYVLSPPLRPKEELEKLWSGLVDGSIDTLGTDHCAFTTKVKRKGREDFRLCPNGIPGVEYRMPILFSEGVMKGRISLSRFVELTSYLPAKLFGLDSKGRLEVGADADLVIFDPELQTTIQAAQGHDASGFTPFEGFECQAWPIATLSRGTPVCIDSEFVGRAGAGRYLKRKAFSAPN